MLCHSRTVLQRLHCLCRVANLTSTHRTPSLQATQGSSFTSWSRKQQLTQRHTVGIANSSNSSSQQVALHRSAAEADPPQAAASPQLQDVEQQLGPFSSVPAVSPPPALVVIVSGPSGVGKDAVLNRLRERRPDIHFVVTATSR